jgi:hypothetical protein
MSCSSGRPSGVDFAKRRQADADAEPHALCGAARDRDLLPELPGEVARALTAEEKGYILGDIRRWLLTRQGA